eukprot:3274725-Lingulodinium_polyedra.AAC.1
MAVLLEGAGGSHQMTVVLSVGLPHWDSASLHLHLALGSVRACHRKRRRPWDDKQSLYSFPTLLRGDWLKVCSAEDGAQGSALTPGSGELSVGIIQTPMVCDCIPVAVLWCPLPE